MIDNPFIAVKDMLQYLTWKNLQAGRKYHVELVQPAKCLISEYKDGAYMLIVAQVVEDSKVHQTEMVKGDVLIINIALRTFKKAWISQPISFRQQLTGDCNLRLKFVKESKQSMQILCAEIVQPTPEQLTKSSDVYDNPDKYLFNYKGEEGKQ